jgi:hypothetical protein
MKPVWIAALLFALPTIEARAEAYATPRTIVARGVKTCQISQLDGGLRGRPSRVTFVVLANGSGRMFVNAEGNYPGTRVYFSLESTRISNDGRTNAVTLPRSVMEKLKADPIFHASWRLWPERNEINYRDRFDGFARAYEQCLQHLRGRS